MLLIELVSFGLTIASINAVAISSYGRPAMIDTDIMSDVDDVGALAVANVLHNCGLADLRGIAINSHSKYGALAASVRQGQHGLMKRSPADLNRQYVLISRTATFQ